MPSQTHFSAFKYVQVWAIEISYLQKGSQGRDDNDFRTEKQGTAISLLLVPSMAVYEIPKVTPLRASFECW